MTPEISWESLIGSIGVDRFEAAYFGRQSLHVKQAFVPSTGLEDLNQWRSSLRGQETTREAHRGRLEIDPKVDTTQPIGPELEDLVAQGGPLIIGAINKINPAIESLARTIAKGLGSFVGVNAYLSPPRKDALDLHYDDHDVIVLQLAGEKLWTLGKRVARGVARSKFFRADQDALKARAIAQDTFHSFAIGPGDLLYLPRGLFHRATARHDVSIHLSFGIRRPTGLDFADLVMQRLIADVGVREYAPRLNAKTSDAEVLIYLDQLRDRIQSIISDDTTRVEFLEQYRTQFDGVTDRH